MRRKSGETAICYGVFREVEHSPGREADDAAILKAAGRRLEEAGDGFAVSYRLPGEISGSERIVPALAFAMCEGAAALEILGQWERRGVCVINGPKSVIRTHREKLMPLLESRRVPTPDGLLLDCADALPRGAEADRLFSACWIKQATEHKTREGDVVFATDRDSVRDTLELLRRRGLTRALVERHVDGDLVKFYGVSDAAAAGDGGIRPASWFRWFHPKEHPVAGHAFDANALRDIACRAAGALELDVWGGDAIVGADGAIHVIDVNAWPSFALFREEAAEHIAVNLMARLRALPKVYA